MGKIFYLMGKSASGKDSIYKALKADDSLGLKGVVMYSTRPMREGETEGVDYFFIDEKRFEEFKSAGKVIESRTYNTVHGPWTYTTIDDGQINLDNGDYLMVGVLPSYVAMKKFFGDEALVPFYIEVEDGLRLRRALERESAGNHRYAEMCRRFLADAEDFSKENLEAAGIDRRYSNEDFDTCANEIKEVIKRSR